MTPDQNSLVFFSLKNQVKTTFEILKMCRILFNKAMRQNTLVF
jgi:hypothetical protein